jgi:protein-disulfide isomerase
MSKTSRKRKGMSWELVGIAAILAVFVVGVIYVLLAGGGDSAVNAPTLTLLEPGSTTETGMTADGRPYLGSADAPVTVYEFADFQCPHCKNFSETGLVQLKSDYLDTGKARLVWVNFPIIGDDSVAAAKGAHCAAEQGQFWTFHDWLFENQTTRENSGAFSSDRLNQMAQQVPDMDAQAFSECLASTEAADSVETDQQLGRDHGVSQTPSFVIGEQLVEGGDLPGVEQAIDAAGG